MTYHEQNNAESEAQIKDLSRAEILESVTDQSLYTNPDRRNFLKGTLGISTAALGFGGVASARGSGASSSAAHDCTSMPPKSQGGIDIDPIDLSKVTESVGLMDSLKGMYAHALAVGDVTGNGWLDIYVGTFADRPIERYLKRGAEGISPDRLLLGGPDGFTVSDTFPEMYGRSSSAVFADFDNDGDLDLVISRNSGESENGVFNQQDNQTIVMENDGEGNFSQVATLSGSNFNGRTAAVFDYNCDGHLDILINEGEVGYTEGSRLFRNQGNFEFVDVTENVGLPSEITALGAATEDFTGNGYEDLLVTDSLRSESWPSGVYPARAARLFLNEGGTFREVDVPEIQVLTGHPYDTLAGIAVADLNRNGRQDLVIGQHIYTVLGEGIPVCKVFLNEGLGEDGAPQFRDVTEEAGIPKVNTRVPHVELVDFNNDGWPDINTSLTRDDGTKPTIFRHTGLEGDVPQFATPNGIGEGETFWNEFVGIDRYYAMAAAADYDRDGQMDSFYIEWFPDLPSQMFYNEGEVGNWLFVDVVPLTKGLGAEIEVFCPGRLGDYDSLIGNRSVTVNTGWLTGVPSEVHFGLGQAHVVDLRVILPCNRGVMERRGVRANQRIDINASEPTQDGHDNGHGKGRGNRHDRRNH